MQKVLNDKLNLKVFDNFLHVSFDYLHFNNQIVLVLKLLVNKCGWRAIWDYNLGKILLMFTDFQDFYLLARESPIPVLTLQTAGCTGMGEEQPTPSKQSFRKTTQGSSEDSMQTISILVTGLWVRVGRGFSLLFKM